MRIKPSIFSKRQFATWLLTIALAFSLFGYSGAVAVSTQQPQAVATELVQLSHKISFDKAVNYHCKPLPAAVNSYSLKPENKYLLLLCHRLLNTWLSYLSGQFNAVRQSIQRPCITCVFHHSGQEPSIS